MSWDNGSKRGLEEVGREVGRLKIGLLTDIPEGWAGGDYLAALEHIQRLARHLARWYHEGAYGVILSPTMSLPPTTLGAFTFIANVTGQPAMSVPLHWSAANIPIAVHGRLWR